MGHQHSRSGVGVSLHLLWRVYIVYEKGKCKYPLTSDRFTALLQQTAKSGPKQDCEATADADADRVQSGHVSRAAPQDA